MCNLTTPVTDTSVECALGSGEGGAAPVQVSDWEIRSSARSNCNLNNHHRLFRDCLVSLHKKT